MNEWEKMLRQSCRRSRIFQSIVAWFTADTYTCTEKFELVSKFTSCHLQPALLSVWLSEYWEAYHSLQLPILTFFLKISPEATMDWDYADDSSNGNKRTGSFASCLRGQPFKSSLLFRGSGPVMYSCAYWGHVKRCTLIGMLRMDLSLYHLLMECNSRERNGLWNHDPRVGSPASDYAI